MFSLIARHDADDAPGSKPRRWYVVDSRGNVVGDLQSEGSRIRWAVHAFIPGEPSRLILTERARGWTTPQLALYAFSFWHRTKGKAFNRARWGDFIIKPTRHQNGKFC